MFLHVAIVPLFSTEKFGLIGKMEMESKPRSIEKLRNKVNFSSLIRLGIHKCIKLCLSVLCFLFLKLFCD